MPISSYSNPLVKPQSKTLSVAAPVVATDASAMATSVSGSDIAASAADGPVLSLVNKKLRALKKKYSRIVQLEESKDTGKTLNKEQSDLLNSKPQISILIDEYEKLRQPLSVALQEELSLSRKPTPSPKGEDLDAQLEDLIRVLYFGLLFDVKSVSQSEFARLLLTRTHERGCCLTYDYVTEDVTELLGEGDLDMISAVSGLLTTRPVCEGVSHKEALEGCVRRAKMWIRKSDEPIIPGVSVTYAGLREKLNKIMALDYFTMTPEMKAPLDVAAAVGRYNNTASQIQVGDADTILALEDLHVGDATHYQQKEEEHEKFQDVDINININQSSPLDEMEKGEPNEPNPSEENNTAQHDQESAEQDLEHNPRDSEQNKEQQFVPRRAYPGQRGGRGGGGPRRGYLNARGGSRRGRGGDGGGYQNGRGQQYYDSGYNPRSYYNLRGRGGGRHNNYGAAHGGAVELGASS